MSSGNPSEITFLFTDIEGSTRLWEEEPDRMPPALARHDLICRTSVGANRGTVVKMTGDGMYAAFDAPADALMAVVTLQSALADPAATGGIAFRVRCGLHTGAVERRDGDFFGSAVNRAARVMGAAHGGQVLLSKAVADNVGDRLPDGVSLLDLGAVRLRDLANPVRVYQLVHPALRQSFPALRSLEATPNNLPQQVTSFIGRERQLAETKALLGNTRLLTLLGAGGLGKTRLSLQVAADLIDGYPDGVWLVELAPLTDPQHVAQAVASVLRVKEEAGRPVQEALVKYIDGRRLLLILDNCEHLLQASAVLVTSLLQAGPDLTIMTSSREPLHVSGEVTYQVPPLAIPEYLPHVKLIQCDAVRLFGERAIAAQPAFAVTDQNAMAVATICQRLDGIPLALELAAARVRSLSVETIAARLTDRLGVLTGGSRAALPRQQTLRACIDWSYNLLDVQGRALLRRLSVFTGGFPLEAAEAVGAFGELGEWEMLDLLTQLVEKSLVELDAEGQRYRLLETVRQYAHELLEQSTDADDVRTRHLHFYLALVDEADAQLHGPQQGRWLARMDVERENLLAAHAWCGASEARAEAGLQLAFGVQLYWMRRGILRLGYQVTAEALARPGAQGRTFNRCRALYAAGNLGWAMARHGEAQAYVEDSLSIARELGDKNRIAAALVLLGTNFNDQGDRAAARRCYEESLVLSEELGDALRLANVLGSLAVLHGSEGNFDAAETLFEKSLDLSRQQGNRNNIAANLCNLAIVSARRGYVARARAHLAEALTIAEDIGSHALGLAILNIAAVVSGTAGHWTQCVRCYGASQAESARQGLVANREDEILTPLIAQARSALGEEGFAAAERAGLAMGYAQGMADARAWLRAD